MKEEQHSLILPVKLAHRHQEITGLGIYFSTQMLLSQMKYETRMDSYITDEAYCQNATFLMNNR